MTQGFFKFNPHTDYSADKLLISDSNRAAYEYACNYPWKSPWLNIYGPLGSGKSHLAHIVKNKFNVEIIEDVTSTFNESKLLHNINFSKENGNFLLLTSEQPLSTIKFKLPDLTSRLTAIISIAIDAPDNQLVTHLLQKHFHDRQLKVSDEVINFLNARVERNFTYLQQIITKIDHLSLEQKRNITIPLIKEILK